VWNLTFSNRMVWYVTQHFYLDDIRFASPSCCKWHEFPLFFFDYRQRSAKVLKNQGFFLTVKAIIMWNVSHHKIIGARRLAYWSWLIFETKEAKGYSNSTASYSLPRYFRPQKNEVKPEFSDKSDEVLPWSNRRWKLRFHLGSIAEYAPILSSGTVHC